MVLYQSPVSQRVPFAYYKKEGYSEPLYDQLTTKFVSCISIESTIFVHSWEHEADHSYEWPQLPAL